MKKNIAHLTSAHSRYDTRIFLKMCSSLAQKCEYKIFLVIADGLGNEKKNDVNIIDVGKKTGGRLSRMTKTVYKVYKKAMEINADIYHLHDPELIPIGLKLRKKGKKVVYDIHEFLPVQILYKNWIPKPLRKPIAESFSLYESYVARKFYSLVVPQDTMLNHYKRFNKHTYCLYNFPNYRKVADSSSIKSKYNLIYAGRISEERGIWNMLELMMILKSISKEYKLTLAGNIDLCLLDEIKKHPAWDRVEYKGVLDVDRLYNEYAKAGIGLIMFNNVGQYSMSYALKLFEYMQNGLTVIMPDFGEWLTFNKNYNVGYCVDPSNVSFISELIDNLSDNKFKKYYYNNIELCENNFSWESQIEQFNIIYNHL